MCRALSSWNWFKLKTEAIRGQVTLVPIDRFGFFNGARRSIELPFKIDRASGCRHAPNLPHALFSATRIAQ